MGIVKLIEEPLKAALSERACVAYECGVRCSRRAGAETMVRGRGAQDFLLDDGTGAVARVRARDVVLLTEAGWRGQETSWVIGDERLPGLRSFLDGRYEEEEADMYAETTIGEGDRVAVVGVIGSEHDPAAGAPTDAYRGAAKRRVVSAEPGRPLLVSKDPRGMR